MKDLHLNWPLRVGLVLYVLTMVLDKTIGLPHWLVLLLLVAVVVLELAGVALLRRSRKATGE